MGAGLGWALREGGADVVTTVAGRSDRSRGFAEQAGLTVLPDTDSFVQTADVVLVVTPPGAARAAADELAKATERTGARLLVADLNAIAPTTSADVAATLATAGVDYVDGSISGPPPWVRPGARLYFSGLRAQEVVDLPWLHATATNLGPTARSAKALKMSTASVYKGQVALFTQAIRSAHHHGVLDAVLEDLRGAGIDLLRDVAIASAKSDRYVPEMSEIALTQAAADLGPELFTAFAGVWADVSTSELAAGNPEVESATDRTAAEIVALLASPRA